MVAHGEAFLNRAEHAADVVEKSGLTVVHADNRSAATTERERLRKAGGRCAEGLIGTRAVIRGRISRGARAFACELECGARALTHVQVKITTHAESFFKVAVARFFALIAEQKIAVRNDDHVRKNAFFEQLIARGEGLGHHRSERENIHDVFAQAVALAATVIDEVVSALEAIFNGVLCLTGISSPNDCRNAEKDFNQAVARIGNLERKILNIELKLQATRSRRETEFDLFTTENGRCLERVVANETIVTELTAQLEGCRNISIASPNNNASVNTSFNVRVKPQVVSIVPKGIVEPNSGYLVVILDGVAVAAGGPVPAGALELAGGETRVRLTVPLPGQHNVIVQLFNGDGTAFAPQMFDSATVNVN